MMHRPKSFDPPWIDFFTRPCPYYVKQHTTFPKFPLLPKEIQLKIWYCVEPDPRLVSASLFIDTSYRPTQPILFRLRRPYKQPGILASTSNGRESGLKIYQPLLRGYWTRSPLIYFNFETDCLQLDYRAVCEMVSVAGNSVQDLNQLLSVKRLMVWAGRPVVGFEQLARICQIFSSLSELSIIEDDTRYNTTGTPHTFLPTENSFRHDWSRLRVLIEAPVQFVRERLTNWTPPTLTIGFRTQFEKQKEREEEMKQYKEYVRRAKSGEMVWVPTTTSPGLEYIPMYHDEEPKTRYILDLESARKERTKFQIL